MFRNVCKQTFHIFYVRMSQKVKGVLMWNFQYIIFTWRRRHWQIWNLRMCIFVYTLSISIFRSSRPKMFRKKLLLKISQNSEEITCASVSLACNFIKIKLWYRCFPVQNTLWWLFFRLQNIANLSSKLKN